MTTSCITRGALVQESSYVELGTIRRLLVLNVGSLGLLFLRTGPTDIPF